MEACEKAESSLLACFTLVWQGLNGSLYTL